MRAIVTRLLPDKRREKAVVEDWPEPEAPQLNHVKTKTLFSGVTNGSERNDLIKGNYARPDEQLPAGWGYQNVGEVVEVGPDCTDLKVGDVVYSTCDHMEYIIIPEDSLVVRVPENVEPAHAALFGMTSVAMRTCRHADIRMGERVLVVGAGIIGQVAAQIAKHMGGRVTVCDINDKRLDMAREIGAAEEVVNTSAENGFKENLNEGGYEVVIDLAGVPGMEDDLVWAAAWRGRLMLIAGRFEVKYNFNMGQGREICIMQNSHFDRSDLHELARLVSRGSVRIAPFIQEALPVAEAKGFYERLRDKPETCLGTVFEW